jgi:holliday junction DNA helicase RuvA
MISSLTGTVDVIDIPYILINVNGVGYKVFVSNDVLTGLEKGKQAQIFTYTHVREDALELFGFKNYSDLKLFELLLSVSGIGPKTAVGAFSLGSSSQIVQAIQTGDVNFFTRVPRLGKKNAQKIIIELKNKVGGTIDLDLTEATDTESSDVMTALMSFGYSQKEAQSALSHVNGKAETIEEKLKLALKYLGK